MGIGALFLTSISTGIITQEELGWVTRNQLDFSSYELAKALKLGQLIDSGQLQLGSRPWILSIEHFNDFYLISMTTSSLISNQDLFKDRQFLLTGLFLSSSLFWYWLELRSTINTFIIQQFIFSFNQKGFFFSNERVITK